jgi:hypothetical protein
MLDTQTVRNSRPYRPWRFFFRAIPVRWTGLFELLALWAGRRENPVRKTGKSVPIVAA